MYYEAIPVYILVWYWITGWVYTGLVYYEATCIYSSLILNNRMGVNMIAQGLFSYQTFISVCTSAHKLSV